MTMRKIVCSVGAIISVVTGGAMYAGSGYPPAVGDVVINGETVGRLIVSERALEVIGNAEACRRAPYKCPAGLNTDGIGNTHGEIGKVKTDNEIAIDWVRNIVSAQTCLTTHANIEHFSQGETDALVSFIFNTGCKTFRLNRNGTKTRIFNYVQKGDSTAFCGEFKFWVYAAGKRLKGLVNRRAIEADMCRGGYV